MNIGNRLKQIFKELNINQTSFAKQIGISPGNISDILNGRSNPSFATLEKIFEIYNINLNWLICGKGDMYFQNNIPEDEILKVGVYKKKLELLHNELQLLVKKCEESD